MDNTTTGMGGGAGSGMTGGSAGFIVPKKTLHSDEILSGPMLTPPQKQAQINAELNALLEKMATAPVISETVAPQAAAVQSSPLVQPVQQASSPVQASPAMPPAAVSSRPSAVTAPISHSVPPAPMTDIPSFSSAPQSSPATTFGTPGMPRVSYASIQHSSVASSDPVSAPMQTMSPLSKPAPIAPPAPRPINPLPSSIAPSSSAVPPPAVSISSFAPSRPMASIGSAQGPSHTQSAYSASQAAQPSRVEFGPNPLDMNRTFEAQPSGVATTSSHKMLWLMVFLTMLFLAAVGGMAYWYFKVYSPALLDAGTPAASDAGSSGAQNGGLPQSAFPAGVHPAGNAVIPVRSTSSPYAPVSAAPVRSRTVPAFDSAQQAQVTAYIKAHIDSLAPIKSSLGYAVTDMTFDGPDRGIVEYGNSRTHYAAVAVAYIDTSGSVHVTSFTILEK